MQHFVNDTDQMVSEAIDGFIRSSGGGLLARLSGNAAIKVVLRSEIDRAKVALVSGGGSGHEPAHAGFVGRGMLTAAVCGEIFASPPVEAVLAAIRAVTGPAGCLLIVKNYNGDRLNFGLAAERARAEGLQVEMVIVADDIAIEGATRPRGVAGTLFVHKLAGYAAEGGADLATVKAIAERAAKSVQSLGIAVSTCKIPGRAAHDRLPDGQAELGLGIHGEPGIERIDLPRAAEIARLMSDRFTVPAEAPLAMLLNNLGGVPNLEMAVVANDVLTSAIGLRAELIVGPQPLMTALDMRGFSISVLPIEDKAVRAALLAPTEAPAWTGARLVGDVPLVQAAEMAMVAPVASADPGRRAAIETVCATIIAAEAELNQLDARVGDGDTGTTMATAARSVLSALDSLPLADPAALCLALADRFSLVMGGSSGVLLSIFAAAVGHRLGEGIAFPQALSLGLDRMQHYGGAEEGDRTMIDALRPAVRALVAGGGLSAAADAAKAGAELTATMTSARAGRSSYLSARDLDGVPDPGAVAVAKLFRALADAAQS